MRDNVLLLYFWIRSHNSSTIYLYKGAALFCKIILQAHSVELKQSPLPSISNCELQLENLSSYWQTRRNNSFHLTLNKKKVQWISIKHCVGRGQIAMKGLYGCMDPTFILVLPLYGFRWIPLHRWTQNLPPASRRGCTLLCPAQSCALFGVWFYVLWCSGLFGVVSQRVKSVSAVTPAGLSN